MPGFRSALVAALAGLCLAVVAVPAAEASPGAQRALSRTLARSMGLVGRYSGGEVVDLNTGRTLYAHNAHAGRQPASVQKLYTTSTALVRFGPAATLSTSVLGLGSLSGGTFTGTLYLRGGGDPSFGSAGFDEAHYGTGATVQELVHTLVTTDGLRALKGKVVADESWFDSLRGTPATGYGPSIYVEGELSAVVFNRGWFDPYGNSYYLHPALEAAQQFVAALKAAGVKVPGGTKTSSGVTPPGVSALASVASPSMATLVSLTNTPSDNFFAEMLLKDLGARYGGGGTTAAGAAVVRATIARRFKLHPRFNDGSGLSRYDRTSPADIVSLLRQQAGNRPFTRSLAVAGRTGTLIDEMRGTFAQNRCQGKTGTLSNVSNLVGYCRARDGHTLAFALLMGAVNPYYVHPIQNRMVVAVARYNG